MLTAFGILLLFLGGLYCAAVLSVAIGWRSVAAACEHARSDNPDPLPLVAVVVPARDEENHIERCVSTIMDNNYPADRFQLIVVDDGSVDSTRSILKRLTAQFNADHTRLKTISLDGGGLGKGRALEAGIQASAGEILLTTDADCEVQSGWIRSMIQSFSDDTGFVAGPVANKSGRGIRNQMESLEFLSLVGFGAGSIGIGRPTICNSANAAYRRHLYNRWQQEIRRAEVPASDELIMHFVHKSTSFRVAFCADRSALVETRSGESVLEFWNQRSRWVSSVTSFPTGVVALSSVVYSFLFLVAVGLFAALHDPRFLVPSVLAFLTKVIVDLSLVLPVCRHFGRQRLMQLFLPAELLHVPYVLATAPAGIFGRTSWKGRSLDVRSEGDGRAGHESRS